MPSTFADLESKYDGFYVPTFEIDVGGETRFSPATGQASSVAVRTAIEKSNRLSFSVAGVYDQSKGTFTGVEKLGLSSGNDFAVRLGYGSATRPVVKGEITDVKPNFPEGSAPTVDVVGHDYRYVMSQSASDDSWDKSTIPDATEAIATEYGFDKVEIGTGGPSGGGASELELERLVQDAESDLDFVRSLTSQFDYEMFSRAGTLRFRRPKTGGSSAVSLRYGRGLRSYQRRGGTSKSQVTSVKHKGVDHYTGKEVSGSSERDAGDGETLLRKAAMESAQEATRRSAAKATEIDRGTTSTITTLGLPDLRIGDWVKLTGLGSVGGETYDGKYYVQSVDHSVGESGFTSTATVSGPKTE